MIFEQPLEAQILLSFRLSVDNVYSYDKSAAVSSMSGAISGLPHLRHSSVLVVTLVPLKSASVEMLRLRMISIVVRRHFVWQRQI